MKLLVNLFLSIYNTAPFEWVLRHVLINYINPQNIVNPPKELLQNFGECSVLDVNLTTNLSLF